MKLVHSEGHFFEYSFDGYFNNKLGKTVKTDKFTKKKKTMNLK